ncbi:MAG: RsmD family RNA methyltransferase [Thermoleophilia bacterium]
MRVIAGAWRGRRLAAPAGRVTRPTADRVREAIFDVLQALGGPWPASATDAGGGATPAGSAADGWLAGHQVLDLFAGAGGLGIEALSRGAAACTFVENDAAAVRVLRANLHALGVPADRGRVVAADYRRALAADVAEARRYTLLFVDPPYAAYAAVQPEVARELKALCLPGSVVVVESARGQVVSLPLTAIRVKRYGDTQVTFLLAGEREW